MTSFNVGFVLFPNLTQLDLTGPLQVLSRLPDAQVHIPARTLDATPSDCGLSLVPTTTFGIAPSWTFCAFPVAGSVWLTPLRTATPSRSSASRRRARSCHLGLHGGLPPRSGRTAYGRRATTHWVYTDLLPLVGATFGNARVVKDGNVTTAAGGRLRHRFRPAPRRRDRRRRNGSSDPAWDRIRPCASVLDRTSRPCARTAESARRRSQ